MEMLLGSTLAHVVMDEKRVYEKQMVRCGVDEGVMEACLGI